MGRANRKGNGATTAPSSPRVAFAAAGMRQLTPAQTDLAERGLNVFFQRYPDASPLRQHWEEEERNDFVNGIFAEVSMELQHRILESKLEPEPLGGGLAHREPQASPPLGRDLATSNQDLVEQAQIINPDFDEDRFARLADDPRLSYNSYEQAVQSGVVSNMNYSDYLRSVLSGVDLAFLDRDNQEIVDRIFGP